MRVKIKPEFSRYYDMGHFDVSAAHDAVDDLVNRDMYFLCNKWYVFKSHADIIEEPVQPKRIARVKPECRERYLESFGQTEFEVGYIEGESMGIKTKYFDPTKHTTHDYQVLVKDFDIVGKTDNLDIHEEKEPSIYDPNYIFGGIINQTDSAKLHKDISSTILLVLARNEKINQLSGRELLSLVGEIADEVVKDFESCELNQK